MPISLNGSTPETISTGTSDLCLNPSTGRVGIGTPIPSHKLHVVGGIRSSTTDGIGYATGAGGSATQITSRTTSVTLNAISGQITLFTAVLNADTTESFTLNNSTITAGDVLILNHISGGAAGSYLLNAQTANGSAIINVRNITASNSASEAPVIAFAVIKAVAA